jgi:hypothetical protein
VFVSLINLLEPPVNSIFHRSNIASLNDTIQNHYDFLLHLGISPSNISSYSGLLARNPKSLERNLLYLKSLGYSKELLIKEPQKLAEHPDAYVKKLRMAKLSILELKRKDKINPNEYTYFWRASPATVLAKKIYCNSHGISYKSGFSLLVSTWQHIIGLNEKNITKEKANKLGRELTRPYKEKYDTWMKDYKKWGDMFAIRRNRRLITKI